MRLDQQKDYRQLSIYINTAVRVKRPQETPKTKYSSRSTGDKSVTQPLVCLPFPALWSTKLDALKEVMTNIPHVAYWPSFTFEGVAIY